MNLFGMLDLSGSALAAERVRAEVVTANMANAETTRTSEGGPYRRKAIVFQSQLMESTTATSQGSARGVARGVAVTGVWTDPTAPEMRYQPGHPDANTEGYVAYPAIDPIQETVDLMGAVRAYQLNASAVQATKQMIQQSIDLLR